uniref:Indolethylamine N-methyltransferase-like n=1 Tax=Geotrypetes seraphini TaxID=260995 RepID=A0A6P8PG55_GEOSA|nr:indolethylamine N-methyltransferase-like [Geotrypetes seraphini]
MESEFTSLETYEKFFDTNIYLETYFTESGLCYTNGYMQFIMENMFKTFTSGGVRGDILLDIGFAPIIYQLLSACDSFKEIIKADFLEESRQELQSWLKNKPGAFDWTAVVKLACELEGGRKKWTEKEAKLRGKVKRVLKCNITQSNPLDPLVLPAVDCLITCLCLEAVCKDKHTFCCALKNISSLLKPGGYLIMGGVLGETGYMVGERKFSCLLLDKEFLGQAIPESGYKLLQLLTHFPNNQEPTSLADYDGYFFILAQKRQTKTI